jgi:hypothetical protein
VDGKRGGEGKVRDRNFQVEGGGQA